MPRGRGAITSVLAALLLAQACGPAAAAEIGEAARARDEPWDPPRIVPLEPGDVLPDPAELEARGARVGEILVRVHDIFDPSDPREDNWLFRTANVLHVESRPRTIRNELTFEPGERLRAQRLEESERILRSRRYLFDAVVRVARYDPEANVADIEVSVRDVWTLNPGVSYSNRGGRSESGFEVEELNLLGRGEKLQFSYDDDVDRRSTAIEWDDPHVGGSRWRLNLVYADLSDGETQYANAEQPFFSFDTRRAYGLTVLDDDRVQSRYDLGREFDAVRVGSRLAELRYGWSKGLREGWARRWLAGFRYDEQSFAAEPGRPAPAVLPPDRRYVYPWLGLEWVEDAFRKTRNRDQIGRTEDIYLGTTFRATLGYSSTAFGARDDAWLASGALARGREYAPGLQWRLAATGSGRLADGRLEDALASGELRHYWRFGRRSVLYAAVAGAVSEDLDPDRQLSIGGENGLRGYPLRYQTGDSSMVVTLEHRVYTDWYPFRLFNVGGAVFYDGGRTWGETLGGQPPEGWLSNVGLGLRLGTSRSGLGSVLHVDFTYALDAVPGEDRFQVTVETRQGF
mgnify:CR=1 FL=1